MENPRGLVFSIVHGSFVDGHGIRTTVFLKGCPLRCAWCCNPEGQQGHIEIKFSAAKCDGCGRCVPVCPTGAIRVFGEPGEANIALDRGLCAQCGKCVEVCYEGALAYFGSYTSVDELFTLIRRDEQYYRASGGGVTIGGGEPTFQPSFTYELLKRCKENYIHIAIDTCGYTLDGAGLRILKEADLLLFDLKGTDQKKHIKGTGASNRRILANLKKLDALGKPIIIRVPLIPGYSDSSDILESAAEFLSTLQSIERVDLLPYHEYGRVKYQELGREYPLRARPLSDERVHTILRVFESRGLRVKIGG
jgi:pyruvate formate lyase activating enzyme